MKKKNILEELLESYRKEETRISEIEVEDNDLLDQTLESGSKSAIVKKSQDLDFEAKRCKRMLAQIEKKMIAAVKEQNAKDYHSAHKRLQELEAKKAEATKQAGEYLGKAVAAIQALGDVFSNRLAELIRAAYSQAQKGLKAADLVDFDTAYVRAQNEHRVNVIDYKRERQAFDLIAQRPPGSEQEHNWAVRKVKKMLDPNYDRFSILNHGRLKQ